MSFVRPLLAISASVFVLSFTQGAHAQATRTWVSGVGDDVNPCSRTAPCKTFAGAISRTAAGGEINCLDPGGFGAITITKSMTLDCSGTFGSILGTGTNGVVVNGAGVNVTIRGMSIDGAGGLNGIRFLQSGTLRVENVRIFGFTQKGIEFAPTGASELFVKNTEVYNNGTGTAVGGISIRPTGTASTIATITQTSIQNNSVGLVVDSTATSGLLNVVLTESTVSGNANGGVSATGGAQIAMTIDKSAVNANLVGISSSGVSTTVQLANSIVTGNNNGLLFSSSGKITSFSSNVISGNLSSNGTPSSTVPSQ